MIIRKVFENKTNKQLLITIPKSSDIKVGDYISIRKVDGDKE